MLPVAAFTSEAERADGVVRRSTSTDSDGTIVSYAWDFGDGTTGTGREPVAHVCGRRHVQRDVDGDRQRRRYQLGDQPDHRRPHRPIAAGAQRSRPAVAERSTRRSTLRRRAIPTARSCRTPGTSVTARSAPVRPPSRTYARGRHVRRDPHRHRRRRRHRTRSPNPVTVTVLGRRTPVTRSAGRRPASWGSAEIGGAWTIRRPVQPATASTATTGTMSMPAVKPVGRRSTRSALPTCNGTSTCRSTRR